MRLLFRLAICLLLFSASLAQAQTSTSAVSYFERAKTMFTKGNLEGAISDYDIAITFAPHWATAYYNRGIALLSRSNLKEAIDDFDKAARINPHLAEAYANRGLARLLQGNMIEAEEDFDRCLKLDEKFRQRIERWIKGSSSRSLN